MSRTRLHLKSGIALFVDMRDIATLKSYELSHIKDESFLHFFFIYLCLCCFLTKSKIKCNARQKMSHLAFLFEKGIKFAPEFNIFK